MRYGTLAGSHLRNSNSDATGKSPVRAFPCAWTNVDCGIPLPGSNACVAKGCRIARGWKPLTRNTRNVPAASIGGVKVVRWLFKRIRRENLCFVLASLLILMAAGCMTTAYTPTVQYALAPQVNVQPVETEAWTLGIRPVEPALPYKQRIVYRETGYELGFHVYAEWAELPREILTRTLSDALIASCRFGDVADAANLRLPDFILTGQLRKFDEDRTVTPREAVCEVRLELRGGFTRRLAWADTLTARVPVEGDGAPALADAMSHAVARMVEQAVTAMAACDLEKSMTDGEQEL